MTLHSILLKTPHLNQSAEFMNRLETAAKKDELTLERELLFFWKSKMSKIFNITLTMG